MRVDLEKKCQIVTVSNPRLVQPLQHLLDLGPGSPDRANLEAVCQYVDDSSGVCQRKRTLSVVGQRYDPPPEGCGGCDICCPGLKGSFAPTSELVDLTTEGVALMQELADAQAKSEPLSWGKALNGRWRADLSNARALSLFRDLRGRGCLRIGERDKAELSGARLPVVLDSVAAAPYLAGSLPIYVRPAPELDNPLAVSDAGCSEMEADASGPPAPAASDSGPVEGASVDPPDSGAKQPQAKRPRL